jgi:hypothetical protein
MLSGDGNRAESHFLLTVFDEHDIADQVTGPLYQSQVPDGHYIATSLVSTATHLVCGLLRACSPTKRTNAGFVLME